MEIVDGLPPRGARVAAVLRAAFYYNRNEHHMFRLLAVNNADNDLHVLDPAGGSGCMHTFITAVSEFFGAMPHNRLLHADTVQYVLNTVLKTHHC